MRGKLPIILVGVEIDVTTFKGHLAICSEDEDEHIALNVYRTEILTQVRKAFHCNIIYNKETRQMFSV